MKFALRSSVSYFCSHDKVRICCPIALNLCLFVCVQYPAEDLHLPQVALGDHAHNDALHTSQDPGGTRRQVHHVRHPRAARHARQGIPGARALTRVTYLA